MTETLTFPVLQRQSKRLFSASRCEVSRIPVNGTAPPRRPSRRSSGERPGRDGADAAAEVGTAADFADEHAARDDLWARLDRLTRAQRAVLVLRYYEDLDDRQIAEVLRCAVPTVRVHAARGLARLRTELTPSRTGGSR